MKKPAGERSPAGLFICCFSLRRLRRREANSAGRALPCGRRPELFEGSDLDLANALAADVEFRRKVFERHRLFGQAARLEDAAFTIVQHFHRAGQKATAIFQLVLLDEHFFLGVMVIDQPVLPLAGLAFTCLDRRVERRIAGEPLVHRDDFGFRNVQRRCDVLDLLGLQITLVKGLDLALEATQVEEQPLLIGGRAHFDERPRAQDIFLDRGLDPPHGIGRQAEAAFRIELLDGLHEADIAFGNDFADRQAITAIAHGDLRHKAQMAGHELMGRLAIVMLLVPLGEHVLFLRLEHGKFTDFVKVTVETALSGGYGR